MSIFNKVKAVFKKEETAANVGAKRGPGGPKIWPVPPHMQQQLMRGTRLNMKVVLRGMRRTGKTTILAHLSGHQTAVTSAYTPSNEISAATICYLGENKKESDATKVEIWDVVDEGTPDNSQPPRKSPRAGPSPAPPVTVADASTVDVYAGCHCAIFVIDRTRKETFEYAVREAAAVPPTTAVLFVLNFHDAPKPHAVTASDVDAACKKLRRVTTSLVNAACGNGQLEPPLGLSSSATWTSVCALSGYGMDQLRKYLEIPNTMVEIGLLETQMRALYRHIEQHQAFLLSERARLHFEVREEQRRQQSEDGGSLEDSGTGQVPQQLNEGPASRSPIAPSAPEAAHRTTSSSSASKKEERAASKSRHTTSKSTGKESAGEKESVVLVTTRQRKPSKGTSDVDDNGIAVGFFDDVSGESEESAEDKSSSDESDDSDDDDDDGDRKKKLAAEKGGKPASAPQPSSQPCAVSKPISTPASAQPSPRPAAGIAHHLADSRAGGDAYAASAPPPMGKTLMGANGGQPAPKPMTDATPTHSAAAALSPSESSASVSLIAGSPPSTPAVASVVALGDANPVLAKAEEIMADIVAEQEVRLEEVAAVDLGERTSLGDDFFGGGDDDADSDEKDAAAAEPKEEEEEEEATPQDESSEEEEYVARRQHKTAHGRASGASLRMPASSGVRDAKTRSTPGAASTATPTVTTAPVGGAADLGVDVNELLRQMQSALAIAPDEPVKDKSKSKKKSSDESKHRHHHRSRHEQDENDDAAEEKGRRKKEKKSLSSSKNDGASEFSDIPKEKKHKKHRDTEGSQ